MPQVFLYPRFNEWKPSGRTAAQPAMSRRFSVPLRPLVSSSLMVMLQACASGGRSKSLRSRNIHNVRFGWSRQRLAHASHVTERTLIDFERVARNPYDRTLVDIRRALEEAGIIFIDENGEGPGVRLRKKVER